MSKKELNLEKLEPAKKLKKAESRLDTEKAVQSIHSNKQQKERVKRITIDLPFSLYVDIRKKTIEEEMTLKDYFIGLVEEDLNGGDD